MKLKKALLIGVTVPLFVGVWTAALWWNVPGKIVFCVILGASILITLVSLACMSARDYIRDQIAEQNRSRRRGYISADTVCAAARWTR